jgi:Xaa-Pro aminopeptidase
VYPHQRERLTHVLQRDRLAALVASSPINLAYVAGSEPIPASRPRLLIVTPAATALVTHARDTEAADADHVVTYEKSPADGLAAAFAALGGADGAIGLESEGLSARDAAAVSAALGPRAVRSGHPTWRAARAVKAPFEIDCLERALVILEEALNALVQVLAPGMTPKEAAAVCEGYAAGHGMTMDRAVVACGKGTRAFRAGDQVAMELAGRWKGYHAMVARAGVLGAPSAAQEEAHAALEAPMAAALAALRAGARAGDVHAAYLRVAGAARTPESIGHGLGLEPQEAPALSAGSDEAVEGDMIVTLSAGGGPGAARLVDTVFVGTRGTRRLNRTQPGLVTLD